MRALTRLVFLAIAIQISSSARAIASEQLFLIAAGPNSTVAERYLRELCSELKSKPLSSATFSSVTIYRTGAGTEEIAGGLFSNPNSQGTPGQRAIDQFSQAVVADGETCAGVQPGSEGQDTRMIEAEWMADGSLRLQGARVRKKERVKLADVHYVDITSNRSHVAHAVAILGLGLPLRDLADAGITWSVRPPVECGPGRSACLLVGEDTVVDVNIKSTPWVDAAEMMPELTATCVGGGRIEPLGSQTIKTASGQLVRFSIQGVSAGSCDLVARLRYESISFDVKASPTLEIAKGSFLIGGTPAFPLLPHRMSLSRFRVMPFITASVRIPSEVYFEASHADLVDSGLVQIIASQSTRSLIQGDLLSLWGTNVYLALAKAWSPWTKDEQYHGRLSAFVESRGDRFGYDLLRTGHQDVPFCHEMAERVFGASVMAQSAVETCEGLVVEQRFALWQVGKICEVVRFVSTLGGSSLSEQAWRQCRAERRMRYLWRPVDEHRASVIGGLAEVSAKTFDKDLKVPKGEPEEYEVSVTDDVADQSRSTQSIPTRVMVDGTTRDASGLDMGLGWAVGGVDVGGRARTGLGLSIQMQGTFLEFLTVDIMAAFLAGGNTSADSYSGSWLSIGGGVRISRLIAGRNGWSSGPGQFLLDLGTGYSIGAESAYLRTQVGWLIGDGDSPIGVVGSVWVPVNNVGTITATLQWLVQFH